MTGAIVFIALGLFVLCGAVVIWCDDEKAASVFLGLVSIIFIIGGNVLMYNSGFEDGKKAGIREYVNEDIIIKNLTQTESGKLVDFEIVKNN